MALRFTLILATIGRLEQVVRFLESLRGQTHAEVQLIVVDQNPDRRVEPLIDAVRANFDTVYLTNTPGLSKARNLALQHVNGDVVGFPDDDCWYPPHLLQRVAGLFEHMPRAAGITGRSIDAGGRTTSGHFDKRSGPIGRIGAWTRGTSYTIFLRSEACRAIGRFDEGLGVGSDGPYGAAEDTDYMIRAINLGLRLEYLDDLTVFHPNNAWPIDEQVVRRAWSYGAGMGRVLRKHNYPVLFKTRCLVRPLLGAALAAAAGDRALRRVRMATLAGRYFGLTKEL